MLTLLKKEINSFLSSLIGYIVIGVFLVFNGLFLWVFEYDSNILDSGFASLEPLFIIAPWVFLFLIPAITMRSFAEERRAGTIEFLLTRPLTDLQIILAKFFAGMVLVVFSLLPTFIYYYSVVKLGNPVGNIDHGGTWGSYVGLLLLAAAYVAMGIFASSLTDNQIVSFIIAVVLCVFVGYGFEMVSSFSPGKFDNFLISLGIKDHYKSLSRGVIDSRDVLYFISLITVFMLCTKTVIESRKWEPETKA